MKKYTMILCLCLLSLIVHADTENQGGYSSPFSSAISATLNSTITYANDGFSVIGFYLVPPTGGAVVFEVSNDGGTNWESVSIRSTTDDLWQNPISSASNYIGSISAVSHFRFRTSTAGSAPGSVIGQTGRQSSISEGVEFLAPPHRFGYLPVHVDASYSTTQTDTVIFTADSTRKFVMTDFYVIVSGAVDCSIRVFDESDSTGHYVFKAMVTLSNQQPSLVFDHSFTTPFISSADGNSWKITTTADCTVDLMAHGYQY